MKDLKEVLDCEREERGKESGELKGENSRMKEDIGVLKARLYLDLIRIDVKVVAEYPDLVEECH